MRDDGGKLLCALVVTLDRNSEAPVLFGTLWQEDASSRAGMQVASEKAGNRRTSIVLDMRSGNCQQRKTQQCVQSAWPLAWRGAGSCITLLGSRESDEGARPLCFCCSSHSLFSSYGTIRILFIIAVAISVIYIRMFS